MQELSVSLRSPDLMTVCVQGREFPGSSWTGPGSSPGGSQGNVGQLVAAHLGDEQNLIFSLAAFIPDLLCL